MVITIKIKNSGQYSYCDSTDDIPHLFINCSKILKVWNYLINWWENMSGIEIKHISLLHK